MPPANVYMGRLKVTFVDIEEFAGKLAKWIFMAVGVFIITCKLFDETDCSGMNNSIL